MNNSGYVLMIALIALSVLTSFFSTYYGVTTILSGTPSDNALVFAYVTIGYGLGNLAVLSLAWSSREAWSVTVIKLFALIYLGVLVMDTVRNGLQGSSGLIRILILAGVLYANWYAIKKVVERE